MCCLGNRMCLTWMLTLNLLTNPCTSIPHISLPSPPHTFLLLRYNARLIANCGELVTGVESDYLTLDDVYHL